MFVFFKHIMFHFTDDGSSTSHFAFFWIRFFFFKLNTIGLVPFLFIFSCWCNCGFVVVGFFSKFCLYVFYLIYLSFS
jgi:hypothetical protein